jgi:hypothetical protein
VSLLLFKKVNFDFKNFCRATFSSEPAPRNLCANFPEVIDLVFQQKKGKG